MYLTRITLGTRDLLNARIKSEDDIHKLVYRLFLRTDGDKRDFLFHIGTDTFGVTVVTVQSPRPPEGECPGRLRTIEFPEDFFNADAYRFTLRFCPAVKHGHDIKSIHMDTEGAISLLCEKGPRLGVDFLEDTLDKVGTGHVSFIKGSGHRVVISYVDMTGVLKVVDRTLFLKAIENGIGAGKAYGLGLLQVIPMKEEAI